MHNLCRIRGKAGNMLKKTVNGKTTTFAFDDANQLVSSTTDGVTTRYAYDAAGRLVKEGSKTYRYGYLDKVLSVTDGDTTRTFTYHADGQLASATVGGDHRAPRNTPQSESFLWDGLALIQRGDEQFMNEPHIGGGNPVASSKGTSYFNDVLGTTIGSKSNGKYSAAALTAFGEDLTVHSPTPTQNSNFFTGKPYVEGLGHAFLMRNYRAGLAKWQTADPMGYPDGWNALAYCGNGAMSRIDYLGCSQFTWGFYEDQTRKTEDAWLTYNRTHVSEFPIRLDCNDERLSEKEVLINEVYRSVVTGVGGFIITAAAISNPVGLVAGVVLSVGGIVTTLAGEAKSTTSWLYLGRIYNYHLNSMVIKYRKELRE